MRKGWEKKKLGEVITLEYGKPLPDTDRCQDAGYPAYGANGIKCFAKSYYFHEKSIIVGRKGSAGEVTLTEQKFWPLDVTYYVKYNKSEYDLKYLFYYLSKLKLQSLAKGVKPRINRNEVYNIDINVTKLPEQRRIVAILDDAFERIDKSIANAEKNIANSKDFFESCLTELLTKKYSTSEKYKLSDVCTFTVGHVGSMASSYKQKGIPFLRSQNIKPFRIELDGVKFIDEEFHDSLKKSSLSPGDVAIVRTGYPGTASVIPDGLPIANCSDLVIARPSTKVLPQYLVAFFNSQHGKKIVGGNLVGTAQKHFNVTAAKNVEIALHPMEEQKNIVSQVDEFMQQTEAVGIQFTRKLTSLRALKQSLLAAAFSGELTADFNPDALEL